ncbi:MAG: aminopeptidase, partial [Candidatus Bathyarchaeota archaeon]|nr:aminopeptidase [Candidatus Bathyarchaeota archaeon]
GTHAQELLEEVGILCYKKGAQPLIMATSDDYSARIYEEVPAEVLEVTPKHYLGAIKEADAYVVVKPFRDPKIQTRFPREKVAARTKANVPIRKVLYGEYDGPGKKWTYAGWPTPEAASFYGIDYYDLERLIIEGMTVPASTIKEYTSRVAERLKGANVLHITDRRGTNFTCRIKDRRINEDDGLVDDHDIEIGDLGNNLPAGEVFIAPHETFGEGTLFCPVTIDRFTNKIVKDVTLHFKDGKLLLDECTARVNGGQMIDSFKRCLEIDSKEKEVRTTNIAELGIGCNPAIDKAIGYILTDEKLSGSVHLAFGSNLGYGGTSRSCMHWDFVTHPSATIEIVGKRAPVMKDGKII